MKLSITLKKARRRAGFTQAEIAKLLGYKNAQFVSNFERAMSYPPIKDLKFICKQYNIYFDRTFSIMLKEKVKAYKQSLIAEAREMR
jgi:transcriptional regulator with XRE-family HTH domain